MTTEGKNKVSKWIIGVICSLSGLLLGTAFGGGIYAERINTNQNDIKELKQTDKELQNLIIQTGKEIRQEIKDFRSELKKTKE
jgi:hypothetical protein